MRRFYAVIAGLLISALSLSSCKGFIVSNNNGPQNRMIYFSIQNAQNETARLATASYSWNDFSYRLFAKVGSNTVRQQLVPSDPAGYATKADIFTGHELALAKYEFVLEAYNSNNQLIFQSAPVPVDLSTAAQTVQFVMYPAGDKKGNAVITLKFPIGEDIKSVDCSTKTVDSNSESNLQHFTTFTTSGDYNTIQYSLSDLAPGYGTMAVFYLNDENGTCIASRMESLVIVGGLTSTSVITVTADDYRKYGISLPLKLDNKQWGDSKKQILLVSKADVDGGVQNPKSIFLSEIKATATFTQNVADIPYYVFIKDLSENQFENQPIIGYNTKVTYEPSKDGLIGSVDMYTVKLPTRGVTYTPVSGCIYGGKDDDENDVYYVAKNQTFQLMVNIKEGYSNTSVLIDGKSYSNGSIVEIGPITEAKEIEVQNITPKQYTIKYSITNNGSAKNPTAFVTSYTIEDTVKLPDYTFLNAPDGFILDGWEDENGNRQSTITPGTTGDKVFTTCWKAMEVKPTEPEKTVEEQGKFEDFKVYPSICASGFSLIVQWKNDDSSTGITEVFVDYNSNGVVDEGDTQITGSANPDENDFTGYILKAEKMDSSDKPASDFTFTIKGGNLAAIEGLGANASNISTVNISGHNTVIGGVVNGKKTGIKLSTLTGQKVNITGQLSGDYSIKLLSQYSYSTKVPYRDLVVLSNAEYMQLNKIECLFDGTAANGIKPGDSLPLAVRDKNGISYIYLQNTASIGLPEPTTPGENVDGGILWITKPDGSISKTEFTLGDATNININCSVFSVKVENGKFMLTQTQMKDNAGNVVETSNLGQTGKATYNSELNTTDSYIYMHMMSKTNELTPYSATEFLKTIHFIKDSETAKLKLTVYLEEVGYDKIDDMLKGKFEIEDDDKDKVVGTVNGFSYYNGSFYLGMKSNSDIDWIKSYNSAKSIKFNGLNGYLINITSDVENNYIYAQMELGRSWIGGARYDTAADHASGDFTCSLNEDYHVQYDSKTREEPSANFRIDSPNYRWQAGPEAGQVFTTGTIGTQKIYRANSNSNYVHGKYESSSTWFSTTYSFTLDQDNAAFNNQTAYFFDENKNYLGSAKCQSYAKKTYKYTLSQAISGDPVYIVSANNVTEVGTETLTGYGNYSGRKDLMYVNWDSGEPNDSFGGQSEECVHYLETAKKGRWNDYNWNRSGVQSYIVEFTPYSTQYGTQVASKPSVKQEAEY